MKIENNVLTIYEASIAKLFLVLLGIALVIGFPLAYSAFLKEGPGSFMLLFVISALLFNAVIQSRALHCVIDKNIGKILYNRGGVLDTKIGESHAEYPISTATNVEVKRFVSRGRDSFECRLVFKGGGRIRLSESRMGLSSCEQYARKVHEFLELERPVAFVD